MENEVSSVFWGWKVLIGICFISFHYINFLRRKRPTIFGRLCTPIGWKFGLKKVFVYVQIEIYQKWLLRKNTNDESIFLPSLESINAEKRKKLDKFTECDMQRIQCLDNSGNSLVVGMIFYETKRECVVSLKLADGTSYELPDAPKTTVEPAKDNDWQVNGLKLVVTEAKRRLRIQFNGLMKETTSPSSLPTLRYVQMNFVWNAEGDWIDVRKDWHSSLMSDAIGREIWRQNEWRHLVRDQGKGYDQWGVARGLITVDEVPPFDFNLISLRQRRWGAAEADTLLCRAGLVGLTSRGACFYIRASCSPIGLTYARYGHMRFPDGTIAPVSDCELLVDEISDPPSFTKNVSFSLTANGNFMDGYMTMISSSVVEGHRFSSRVITVQLAVNGERGWGIAELWHRRDDLTTSPQNLCCKPQPLGSPDEKQILTVRLQDIECLNPLLTGGKGSSLSFLSKNDSNLYVVPSGFCLTVEAMEKQIDEHPMLKDCLHSLRDLNSDELALRCVVFEELMKTTPLCPEIVNILREALEGMQYPLAVRSSAVGEDGEKSSSAGQNSTFLGLYTFETVADAVLNCWSSLYSLTSVQYRKEHGMELYGKMALVIQEMVDAEVAGVLFTAHPTTLDPRKTVISANYGLGDTVVSASVDPDAITLLKGCSENFTIVSKVPGRKDMKIVLTNEGTKEVSLTDQEALEICVSDEQLIKLAHIGNELSRIYGRPLDLEWAISGGAVYLLQARPITTASAWSDHELLHEFDSPVFSHMDLCSTANTGEILPGATSTLTLSTFGAIVCNNCPLNVGKISSNRVFLDLYRTTLRILPFSIDLSIRITDLSISGHEAITPEVFSLALRRNGATGLLEKFQTLAASFKSVWSCKKHVKRAEDLARSVETLDLGSSVIEMYDKITELLKTVRKIYECHYYTSRASSTSQVILFSILSWGNELTSEHFLDIGMVLSSCARSVSSGIPIAMERLAYFIAGNDKARVFSDLPPLEAIATLKEIDQNAAELWDVFMKKFGHRGWRELDVATPVWALESTPVIEVLQELVKRNIKMTSGEQTSMLPDVDPKVKTVDDIIGSLKTPLKPSQRFLLKKFIGLTQSTVSCRERTKEALISTIHKTRQAYLHIARLLVSMNKLPRPRLIFHLTHSELRDVISESAGDLIVKASQRQRLWKTWDHLEFPEIMTGVPCPLENKKCGASTVKLVGTLVYPGCVVGRALIAQDLKDARDAQPGDILITRSTDVGWSPYFPLLGGVVTELGGLISHGAVVAREYGLPCIVGVQGATSTFLTGDMVMLNATTGVIEAISSATQLIGE